MINDSNNQLLFILKQRQQEISPLRYHSNISASSLSYPAHKTSELLSFEHSADIYSNISDQVSIKNQSKPSFRSDAYKTATSSSQSSFMVKPKPFKTDSQKSPIKYKQPSKSLNASKKDSFKYISPFILIAEQRAKERARKALVMKSRNSTTQSWNADTSAPSLFDPHLKKQELFKIQPRKPKSATVNQDNDKAGANDSVDSITIDGPSVMLGNLSPDKKPTKLTIRSHGISPSRRTLSSPLSPAIEDVEHYEYQLSSPPKISSRGGDQVSTATSPINHHSQSPLVRGSGSKPFEPAVSRATSPMDSKVLQDIFGSSDHENLHTGRNKNLEAGKRIQEDDTSKHRQRLIDSLGSPIRLPEYRSPISTPAKVNESTSPFIAAMNTNVDNALRELKETFASRVHPSAAAVKSHSPHRKRSVHTATPIENNVHNPILNSAIATDQMMMSMADLMKAVSGILSNNNNERNGSRSPHSHRRRRDRRTRSRSLENDFPIQQERLVRSQSPYTVSGCIQSTQVLEAQGQQPMSFTGPDSGHTLETRKNKKSHLVIDISGNVLNSENMLTSEGKSPSSIFDAIIAKLQSIEESESEMLRYLAISSKPGEHNHSIENHFSQSSTTQFSDKDGTNITKLPGGNSNFTHQQYVSTYEDPGHARQPSNTPSIHWKDSAPSTAVHRHEETADRNDLVVGNPQAAAITMDILDTPNISSTHENALSNYMDTLSRGDSSSGSTGADGKSGGLGWLALLGVSTKVSRDKVHRQEQRERIREKELAYLDQFPRLKEADLDCGFSHDAILSYRNELARARQLKDIPFMSRGVTMSDVADSVGREITDQVMRVVCEEVDQYLNELTDSLINRI